jgi:hypothetical protein
MMTEKAFTIYGYEPRNMAQMCSGPLYSNYYATAKSQHHFQVNEPEHRGKPSDLINGMTALPLQFDERRDFGWIWKRYGQWPDYTPGCKPYLRPYFVRQQFDPSFQGEELDWNWELAIRGEIERMRVNLGESLAEYRETVAMYGEFSHAVKQTRDDIKQFLKDSRHGSVKRVAKSLNALICDASNLYLQYTYGLKPLASDLGSAVAALETRLESPVWKKITRSKKQTSAGVINTGYSYGHLEGTWQRAYACHAYFYVKYGGGEYGGVSAGNPIEWIWEIIPFSFIVDWGIDIGGWLSSLDATRGVSAIKGTVSHKRSYRHNCKFVPGDPAEIALSENKVDRTSFVRDLYSDVPLPRLPKWDPSATYHKLLNAISILKSIKCS